MSAEYNRAMAQLQNEGFLGKAPAKVVEGLKRRRGELELLIEKAQSALHELNGNK